ncbi:MAG: methyltransferase [Flavobacteriales bacterium]|nr:methyltransferase [Flavobacteriales bacterium]|tara:strand:+ start:1168 stop:1809 length:642 start_codon:yes stop_codon:yes gene_type:complete
MEFIPQKISDYSNLFSEKESDLLQKISRETHLKMINPRMLSGHIQGRFLSMISKMIKPINIIEVGTFTGYSTLCLAEGLKKNGKIHTIDINEEYAEFAKKYFIMSDYKKKINQYVGDATKIIPKIKYNFQLAFIDADKTNYSKYYDLIFKKLDINGYIIADNVLWSGKVTENRKDKETNSIHNFNNIVMNDNRIENILLPIRDGLMICRKIKN